MRTARIGASLLSAGVLLACGGGAPPPPTVAAPPVGTVASSTPSSDIPETAVSGESDEVTKGIAALKSSDYATAKLYFDAAHKKNPKDGDAVYYQGVVAEKTGDKETAEKDYKTALKLRPDLDSAAENLSALYDDAQRFDDAIALAKAALARRGDDAALHANLGIAYAGKGDAGNATAELDQAVKLAGNDAAMRLTYAHSLIVLKMPDAALVQLRAARPLAADNVGALAEIGHELHQIKAFSDCVPTFDKAIAIKDAAELRTERAACKLGAKDTDGALADLQTAVTNEPTYAPAHYYLANALAMGGKFKPAVAEYEAFLKLAPTGPMAKSANDKIKLAKQKMGK